jgi:excisionase family DNA binding protein
MSFEPAKLYVSPRDLVDLLGISAATVARRIRDGGIPHIRLGRRILIPRAWVDSLAVKWQEA